MNHDLTHSFMDIVLKPMTKDDSEAYRIVRNREENRKWFTYSEIISSEEQDKWFNKYLENREDYMFSAFHIDNPDRFIGAVSLYNIDSSKKEAEFGRILVDKSQLNIKGIGFMIAYCVCHIGFYQLLLSKIKLEVFSDNIPAIKTYEKVGFHKTEEIVNNGRVLFKMELLRDDFTVD